MVHPTTKSFFLLLVILFSSHCLGKPYRFEFIEQDSKTEFEGTGKPSLLKIHGSSEKKLDGAFVFEGRKLSVKAVFDLNGLDTGIELRNEHMKDRYLEVKKFPKAELIIREIHLPTEFASSSFSFSGPFQGVLQLHGATHPVSGTIEAKVDGEILEAACSFSLSIRDFKIQRPSYANISMTDDVKVNAKAKAKWVRTP
ncbi:YceI family protein [bacterium]|nr:YceI family protein [bacterium]